jgi:hypothetical protein
MEPIENIMSAGSNARQKRARYVAIPPAATRMRVLHGIFLSLVEMSVRAQNQAGRLCKSFATKI